MKKATLDEFREIIHRNCGISLGRHKSALISSRIAKRMRVLGLASHEDYLALLTGDLVCDEMTHLVDAISTNVTSFYREAHHFDFLGDAIQRRLREGQKRIRIWSAASSTGEEPYTIAITMLESGCERVDTQILATDISTQVLSSCRAGLYAKKKLDGVPPELHHVYFDRLTKDGEIVYRVAEAVRRMVKFARLNLIEAPFPMKGPLDAIFCRNVMIYFDNNTRRQLMNEFWRLLRPGGHLFVGSSEGAVGSLSDFKIVKPSVYIRP